MKTKTTKTVLTADNLKNALWDTLQQVKAKNIDPTVANAVSSQAREIMRVVRTQVQIAVLQGKKPTTEMLEYTATK
jgi:hypothetical protein